MTKLTCPECRHQNEPERIYCHDCGARLDRSGVAAVKAQEEAPHETQRRLQKLMSARGIKGRRLFFHVCKLVLGAVAAAALIQIFSTPDVPPRVKELMVAPQINFALESAAEKHGPELRYTQQQVNAFLSNTLKSQQAALSRYVQFERALVGFDEGTCSVTTERSFLGCSVYLTGQYHPELKGGKFEVKTLGGSIGRLPIHPALMQYCGFAFADLRDALERERKLLVKMSALEFHPETIVIRP